MEPALPGPKVRAPPALADHLLEEILVRIGAPADLARTSAACKAFRRITTDPTFLRRYRSLHPPLLLGFIGRNPAYRFVPADAPHPNAPAARAFALAADFSFDHHLPPSATSGWERCDVRDGRVLVMSYYFDGVLVSPKLALCDPLTREYTLLPPIPDDLLASVVIQAPAAGLMVLLSRAALGVNEQLGARPKMCPWISYAYGCVYCDVGISNKLVKYDINSMEFTTARLPSHPENRYTKIVEVSEGRIGIFSLINFKSPLHYSIWQNQSENANEHPLDTTIPLPHEYKYYHFDGGAHGYIFLVAQCWVGNTFRSTFFSLEIKTMKVEKVCSCPGVYNDNIPYFGLPPFLSPRRM